MRNNPACLAYSHKPVHTGDMETNGKKKCTCGTCDYCAFKLQMLWERDPWPGYISHYTPPEREGADHE